MKKIISHGHHQRTQEILNIGNCLPGENIINGFSEVSEPLELSSVSVTLLCRWLVKPNHSLSRPRV
jgi:hypothetical protein